MKFHTNKGFMPSILANEPGRMIIVELRDGSTFEGAACSFVWQIANVDHDLVAWAYSYANVNGDLIQ